MKNAVESITQLVKDRKQRKLAKFFHFNEWVNLNTCRREGIKRYFSEKAHSSQLRCCDQCGIELNDYFGNHSSRERSTNAYNWEKTLFQLLVNDRIDKHERS